MTDPLMEGSMCPRVHARSTAAARWFTLAVGARCIAGGGSIMVTHSWAHECLPLRLRCALLADSPRRANTTGPTPSRPPRETGHGAQQIRSEREPEPERADTTHPTLSRPGNVPASIEHPMPAALNGERLNGGAKHRSRGPPLNGTRMRTYSSATAGSANSAGRKSTDASCTPDNGSATIDHIIPLSKGGRDEPANVQLAHLLCNCKKHTSAVGEQMRLI